jgi:hypothetical protein
MPQSPAPPVFFTIKQIAERHPALTERTLRHWIFAALDRPDDLCTRNEALDLNAY